MWKNIKPKLKIGDIITITDKKNKKRTGVYKCIGVINEKVKVKKN